MKIELHEIPVYEIFDGYHESEEEGVVGYGGKLNIRPAFQREFVYADKQRDEVVRSIRKGFPLNIMYWSRNNDGTFELLDGQQRTISICRYVSNDYLVDSMYFQNLTSEEQNQIMNYKLMIYFCEGEEREKLDWFEIVNIAGLALTKQELRNATYTGPWLTDAKKFFSRRDCPASKIAGKYLEGDSIRQDYLEKVIEWAADHEGFTGTKDEKICEYMAKYQNESTCTKMWLYFKSVMDWAHMLFKKYRREMKGREWGKFYNIHHERDFDPVKLEEQIELLMEDEEVTSKSGIYEYLFDGQEKHLNLRKFSAKDSRTTYEKQKGLCAICGKAFEIEKMQADHIIPWSKGGRTILDNCQMLCKKCNATKGNK